MYYRPIKREAEKYILPFWGEYFVGRFWDKISLIKFAFFQFYTEIKKEKDEIIELILRYSSGDIFANTCSET